MQALDQTKHMNIVLHADCLVKRINKDVKINTINSENDIKDLKI